MRFLLCLFALSSAVFAQTRLEHLNLENAEALSGYDPVSYFEGKPEKGDAGLALEHSGVRYLFASESNREAFKADPEKYEPAYGGWCAYAMLDGEKVEIDPLSFKIIDGKLRLFYNGFWGDTLKRWNKKLAKTPEASLVAQADSEWRKILQK